MEREGPTSPSSVAPITASTVTAPSLRPCRCSPAEEEAEFQQMLSWYSNDVNNARAQGYQAGNDPGYSDPGLGFHRVGNCADWAQVSWAALVTRSWQCWHVQKIRARQHWTVFGFHHFVRLQSCRGRVVFFDPWPTGKPDWWEAKDFPFADGVGWAHTPVRTHQAGDNPRDPGLD